VVEKLSIIEITRFVCLFVSFFHHPFSTAIPPCILDINLCEHRDSMLPPYTIEISSVPGLSFGTRVQNRPKLHGDWGGGGRIPYACPNRWRTLHADGIPHARTGRWRKVHGPRSPHPHRSRRLKRPRRRIPQLRPQFVVVMDGWDGERSHWCR
jgi:hypothetical protein